MTDYTPTDVLDKLIAAGLGDVRRDRITPDEWVRAMAGEIVRQPKLDAGWGTCGCGATVRRFRGEYRCLACRLRAKARMRQARA